MELLYIMTSQANGMAINALLNNIDEETKKEKLIEIMKVKIFNKEEENETIVLSNSWGYGINERSFIGSSIKVYVSLKKVILLLYIFSYPFII